MKLSLFKKIMAWLLVLLVGFLLPACTVLPAEFETTGTTLAFSVLTEEAESKSQFDDETEDSRPQAPPTEAERSAEDLPIHSDPTTQTSEAPQSTKHNQTTQQNSSVTENGQYNSKDEVALYIRLFGHLPSNYITKKQAQNLGWSGGSLKKYAPGCSIGGDRFGNYEGLLPKAKGRYYTECDIDTKNAKSRGAKRIVFSNDGLIFYTNDHYESFTQLYG